jgi:hypothetical protein
MLERAGFVSVEVVLKEESKDFIKKWLPGSGCEDFVISANITARKPKSKVESGKKGGWCDFFSIFTQPTPAAKVTKAKAVAKEADSCSPSACGDADS